ncbi:hypothetical protein M426DRAFT_317005 [Hypoxylon sp. CI-4A]|nr:hypothetical protein M426DRAFT_317005 [Hypoxylon sp. CI-4A]
MSVPPQLIRVKRKATEEAPVSFLRVQENKRHRTEAFVYQRQEERPTFAENIPSQVQKPVIHISQPTKQTLKPESPETPDTSNRSQPSENGANNKQANVSPTISADPDGPASEPRRFHMSRKDTLLATPPQPGRSNGGISKKRSATALFVERKIKRISTKHLKNLQAATDTVAPRRMDVNMDNDAPRKLKKPGISKYQKKGAENGAKKDNQQFKAELPVSLTERWNVDMDKLTEEMNSFAMAQIGLNLQKAEEDQKQSSAKSKYKYAPKQIKRYAERHPEEARGQVDSEMMDAGAEISDSDASDYIIETYERIPASKMGEHVPPQSIGVLVFDQEPDLELFYAEGADSDEEEQDDEEDENAENYYAADYPDEEVASDDEFGQNPYSFRTGNASDLEEYDLDDEEEASDDSGKEDEDGIDPMNQPDNSDEAYFNHLNEDGRFKVYIGRRNNDF